FSHGRRWRPSRPARNDEEARWLWAESARLIAQADAGDDADADAGADARSES
ncbi:MAG: hypothetical protein JWN46_2039, partial [Acidimicrobiales bacterium]|nr:hypothetical protein [Acidimicrobiales bacterium]